ncbi:MAG: hypothetical protein ACJ8AO_21900 [Gemmatimonadaceae bacterium]
MDARKLWVVVGLLAATCAALPARAQRRGTVEVGAFANAMDYDRDLHIREGIGAGARVGVFVARNWSAEVEGTLMRVDREGAGGVRVAPLYARLGYTADVPGGRGMRAFFAGGVVRADYEFRRDLGLSGVLGTKLAAGDRFAARVEGTGEVMPGPRHWNTGLRLGLSLFESVR